MPNDPDMRYARPATPDAIHLSMDRPAPSGNRASAYRSGRSAVARSTPAFRSKTGSRRRLGVNWVMRSRSMSVQSRDRAGLELRKVALDIFPRHFFGGFAPGPARAMPTPISPRSRARGNMDGVGVDPRNIRISSRSIWAKSFARCRRS